MSVDLQQPSKLRIGVATSGRFHLLDLARELDALGMDVRFYSYVSRKRAAKFGLPERCHVALLPFLFPLVALERLFPRFIPRTIERLMSWALTWLSFSACGLAICLSACRACICERRDSQGGNGAKSGCIEEVCTFRHNTRFWHLSPRRPR